MRVRRCFFFTTKLLPECSLKILMSYFTKPTAGSLTIEKIWQERLPICSLQRYGSTLLTLSLRTETLRLSFRRIHPVPTTLSFLIRHTIVNSAPTHKIRSIRAIKNASPVICLTDARQNSCLSSKIRLRSLIYMSGKG